MKTRGLSLKRQESSPRLSLATATGPVFAMLDPPGVEDAHGDTMDAGALRLPEGVNEVPLYWVHSYHPGVVPEASPEQRLPVGSATVWEEGGQWYFEPHFNRLTELSQQVEAALQAGDINACSIGYRTVRGTPNGKGPDAKGEDVHEARLLEVSLVDKGAKSSAVRVKMDEPQQPDLVEQLKALANALTELTPKLDRLVTILTAEKEPGAEKQPPAQEPETKDEPKEPPPAEPKQGEPTKKPEDEDPVTKWLRDVSAQPPTPSPR